MILSSFKQWLFEAVNIPLLRNQYNKLHGNNQSDFDQKVNLSNDADPTSNKKYINWIFRELINGRMTLPEEKEIVRTNLDLFDRNKNVLKRYGYNVDIDKHTKQSFIDMMVDAKNIQSKRQKSKEAKEGAIKLYQDNDWTIIKIIEGKAAPFYAKGTTWCTSDEETASNYIKEGPLYVFFHKGKPYGQLHIKNKEFKSAENITILPESIPEELKIIAKNNIDIETKIDKSNLYELFGIEENVLTYPNHFRWSTNDFMKFILYDETNKGKIIAVIDERNRLIKLDIYNFRNRMFENNILNEYKKYGSYIVDIVEKYVKEIIYWGSSGNIGLMSSSQIQHLFTKKPELKPKIVLKTKDGNLWTKDETSNKFTLLDNNYFPILMFDISDKVILYGSWNLYATYKDKKDYSYTTCEFIINFGIEHVNYKEDRNLFWNFDNLEEEDKQKILEKSPYFNDPIGFLENKSHSTEDFIKKINNLNYNNFKYFNENNVIIDEHDTISKENLTLERKFSRLFNKTTSHNVNVAFSYFYDKVMQGYYDIMNNINILSPETIDLINKATDKGIHISSYLKKSIENNLIPRIIKRYFKIIKDKENDKFKIILKDDKIYFITSIENIKNEFKTNYRFDELIKKYKEWKQSFNFTKKDFINMIDEINVELDADTIRNIIHKN